MWDILGLQMLVLAALVFVPLERLFSTHPQKLFRQRWTLDLTHALVSGLAIKLGLALILFLVVVSAESFMPAVVGETVSAWPLWVQIPLALLLSDLGFYWVHRLFHAVPFLWRFHSVHHSIQQLDWLAGSRVHPLDQTLTKGASILPVFALGFSETTIVAYGLIYFWQSLLLHSNVNLHLPFLSRIIALPRFHHWHHADHEESFDTNFAGQLAILDWVFGTWYAPADQGLPSQYGTQDPVPSGYLDQLLYPFGLSRADTPTLREPAPPAEPELNTRTESAGTVSAP